MLSIFLGMYKNNSDFSHCKALEWNKDVSLLSEEFWLGSIHACKFFFCGIQNSTIIVNLHLLSFFITVTTPMKQVCIKV